MVASVICGQHTTQGVGPIYRTTNHRAKHQEQWSPSPKMVPYWYVDIIKDHSSLSYISLRGSEHSSTPMPGIRLQSLIRDLILSSCPLVLVGTRGRGRRLRRWMRGSQRDLVRSVWPSLNMRVRSMEGVRSLYMTGLTMPMAIAAQKVPGSS